MRVRFTSIAARALLAAMLLLGACTTTNDGTAASTAAPVSSTTILDGASTTTIGTTIPPLDTTQRPRRGATTTTLSDPLADSILAQYGRLGPDLPLGASTDPYNGSGCTVEGDELPDGIWFGHILEYEIASVPGSVAFDLACVEGSGLQTLVYNQTPRIRQIALVEDTRFVFVHDQVVLTPNAEARQISSRFADRHNIGWGWGLIEEGTVTEFYIPDMWAWQNRTHHDRQSTIPDILHPDPTSVEMLTAADGFDGSGCSPTGDSLPDGLWFGRVRFTSPSQLNLNLWCSISDVEQMTKVGIDPEFVEDRTSIDDGDDSEYEFTIATDAVLYMTFIDGNYFQTPLALDDPRYLHLVNGPQPPADDWMPGMWVRVENGVVVEGYNYFSA